MKKNNESKTAPLIRRQTNQEGCFCFDYVLSYDVAFTFLPVTAHFPLLGL